MLDRGRAQIGEQCSWSKLSNKDVLEIRDAVANGKRGIITKLSKLYGVSHQTISDIKLKKRWKSAS